MGGLRTAQVMSKFNKPLFDVSLWVVNKELVMLGSLK